MRILRSTVAVALVALGASSVFAAPALAVQISGGATINVYESAPENNTITITGSAGTYLITDTTVPPSANAGCVATADPNTLSYTASERTLLSFGGDGVDTVVNQATDLRITWSQSLGGPLAFSCGTSPGCAVTGSPLNDTITGGRGFDSLQGGPGNDVLRGAGSSDQLVGGPGNDTVDGGSSNDLIMCDEGADAVSGGSGRFDIYSCESAPAGVSISLDGVANDGIPGEGDNIAADFESIGGSAFDDVLIGTAGRQSLNGGDGNDTLRGGDGADFLAGGDGNDLLQGQNGDDLLDGGEGADRLNGGTGTDIALYADREANLAISLDNKPDDGEASEGDNVQSNVEDVEAGAGDDTITGSRAANTLRGGPGNDTITGGASGDEIHGGPGDDLLAGGTGRDEVIGGSGNDHIGIVDRQPDIASCGAGNDTVTAQRAFDTVYATCERTTWR